MKLLMQCGILLGICIVGDIIHILTNLPIPGNVFGILIIFILLYTGVLKKAQIRWVSKFFLNNMAFFFVPSGVAIIIYYTAVAKMIVPFLLIILFTTIIVLSVTGQSAQLMQKLLNKNAHSVAKKL